MFNQNTGGSTPPDIIGKSSRAIDQCDDIHRPKRTYIDIQYIL